MNLFFFMLISVATMASTNSDELVKTLVECYSAKSLHNQVNAENELRTKLQRPDFRLRVASGYTNNEISSANPERFQVGANLRWEDIFDQQRRSQYQDTMSKAKLHETKLLLENYWRQKITDFYYWKWGHSATSQAKLFLDYTKEKIASGSDSFNQLATTRIYADLIELNRVSSEFLGRMNSLQQDFNQCAGLKARPEKLDFDQQEVKVFSNKKTNRLLYQGDLCEAQKKIRSISLAREAGLWGVSLSTSITRNRQLGGESNEFNDFKAGVEVTIPLTGIKAQEVTFDSCDYEARLLLDEDLAERSFAHSLYPILSSLQGQFKLLKKKARALEISSQGAQTQDLVQLGLNFFQLHQSLARGEAQMNARLLPSRIVEYEF